MTIVSVLCLLALLGWFGWLLYDAGHLSREGMIALANRSGMWAPLLVIGAMVLAVVVGPIPTIPVSVASGAVFGGAAGFTLAMLGALLGAWISFHIARAVGQPVMERLFRGHATFCPHCSTRALFWAVLMARLVPVVSFAAVSYAAGLTAMRATPFLVATAIGMAPMTILYVAIGAAVRIDPVIAGIGGVIAAVLLITLPRLIERFDPFGLRRAVVRK
ncbi:MAG: VTT domain-containing protein [Halofilum sp. (in: g-proteobacteria)]|nr:VTT domain-containing protein [Halofilum sp. (in: g-proteobacteria)]